MTSPVLDERTHTYTLAGQRLPGVTSVLDDEFDTFRFVDPGVLEYARELGTAVHAYTEAHDLGTLDDSQIDPAVAPYLAAYRAFLAAERPTMLEIERVVHHGVHGYAGKKDRGLILRGHRGILDIKTSAALDLALVGPQTAAYMEARNNELRAALSPTHYHAQRYTRRWALQLREDGAYTLKECADPADFAVFLSCLNLYRWRQKHGKPRR